VKCLKAVTIQFLHPAKGKFFPVRSYLRFSIFTRRAELPKQNSPFMQADMVEFVSIEFLSC